MPDCLHCDINDLVEEQLKIEGTELVEVASKIAESSCRLNITRARRRSIQTHG